MGDLATQSNTLDSDEAHFGAPTAPVKIIEETLWVIPSNWLAVRAITCASSQWQYDKNDVEIALDYARADIAWRYAGIELKPDDFDKLQVLERNIIGLIRRSDEQKPESGTALIV